MNLGSRIITAALIVLFAGLHSAQAQRDRDHELAAVLKAARVYGHCPTDARKETGPGYQQETR